MNIYQDIKQKKGFLTALAPMEGVTNTVFRRMISEIGRPDLFFTEFLNVEGFCSKGRPNVIQRLDFVQQEQPLVIQLWGNVPEYYAKTIEYVKELQPAGIDINMGCSVRDVLSSGRGSALINDKVLAKEIISAVKEASGKLPVSEKTRIGYDHVDLEGWIGFLLEQNLAMLTVHGRLAKETYSTPAQWDQIANCVSLRNSIAPDTLLIGNGDVKNHGELEKFVQRYGVDGVMVGRYILNNPWFFSGREEIPKEERINTLKRHLEIFKEYDKEERLFDSQKKYIKAYINNFEGASDLRLQLLRTKNSSELFSLL
jgi:tRNA-dihydrouridine synthase